MSNAERRDDDGRDDDTPPSWAHWLTWGGLAVALVALVIIVRSVGLSEILTRLAGIGRWFAVVIALEVAIALCDAAAIRAFVSPERIRYRDVLFAQVAGRAINVVTPTGSVGEVVKVTMLLESVSRARAVSAILLANFAALEIQLLIMGLGAPLTAVLLELPPGLELSLWAFGASGLGLAAAIWLVVRRGMLVSFANLARRMKLLSKRRYDRWHRRLRRIDQQLRGSDAGRPARMWGFGFALLSRALATASIVCLLGAAGATLSFGLVVAVVAATPAVQWISNLVPLGLGISESSHYAMFAAVGQNPALGVTLSFAKRVTQLIFAAIGLVLVASNVTVKEARAARRRGQPPRSRPPTAPT